MSFIIWSTVGSHHLKAIGTLVKMEYLMKFALLALCVTFAATNAYALECTVDDPTGTPLNVRSGPNGPIVDALHNGAAVFVSDLILDGSGRRWAKIVPIGEGKSGWVFRDYLMCRSASAPTDRVRLPPRFLVTGASRGWKGKIISMNGRSRTRHAKAAPQVRLILDGMDMRARMERTAPKRSAR